MFSNVSDERLRSILESESTDRDDIIYALDVTSSCILADADDADISVKALECRATSFDAAYVAWEVNRDAALCIEALRDCWSV